jgi:Domain of unknown function (DUF4334)
LHPVAGESGGAVQPARADSSNAGDRSSPGVDGEDVEASGAVADDGVPGVVTATMSYDALPINDHFRRVDADTVIGVMDVRSID